MASCKGCKETMMENVKTPETIPYLAYEGAMARNERAVKRLVIALILAISMIFASNGIWLYCWMQYDYSSEEIVTVDGKDGVANYIGNDGDITNGKDYSSESENTP